MDAWTAKQPETRFVDWHWSGQHGLVTLTRWHWYYFDYICSINAMPAETIHRDISERYPYEGTESLAWSISRYLELRWDAYKMRRDKLVNDNYSYQRMRDRLRKGEVMKVLREAMPEARETSRRARPIRHRLPRIQYSPFKNIARARQLRPEAEIRDPFNQAN